MSANEIQNSTERQNRGIVQNLHYSFMSYEKMIERAKTDPALRLFIFIRLHIF